MKPLKIKMQAFGPYEELTCIDFSLLNNMFLITGPTGGGKTVILDAMCFALYCRSTGALRSFKDMRNISVSDNIETFVEFDFLLNNKEYRFKRTLKVHKIRNSDRKELRDENECLCLEDDNWKLCESGSESKVREYAEKLLGLDCEQFSKVMILPQGEFRNLILANSKDKAEIFQKLFLTNVWEKISEELKKIDVDLKNQVNKIKISKDSILNSEDVKDIDELKEKRENIYNKLKKAKEETIKIEKELSSLKDNLEKLKKIESLKENLNKSKKEIESLEKNHELSVQKFNNAKEEQSKLDNLNEKLKEYSEKEFKLEAIIENLEKVKDIETNRIKFVKQNDNLLKNKNLILKEKEKLEEAITKNEKHLESITESVRNLPSLFIKVQNLKSIIESYNSFKKIEKENIKLKSKYEETSKRFNLSIEKINLIEKQIDILNSKLEEDMEAHIAEKLQEGLPCPVCGALEHPLPKKRFDIDEDFIKNQIKLLKENLIELKNFEKNMQSEISFLKAKLESKNEELKTCEDTYKSYNIDYNSAINDLNKNNEKLNKAQECEVQEKSLNKLLIEEKEDYKLIVKELEGINIDIIENQKKIDVLNENKNNILNGLEIKENYNIIYDSLSKTKEKINNIKEKIKLITETYLLTKKQISIDLESLKNFRSNYKKESLEYEKLKENIENEYSIEICNEKINGLHEIKNDLLGQIGKLNQLIESTDKSINSINALNKDDINIENKYSKVNKIFLLIQGKNDLKIPLKIFVLGVILDDVLSYANIYFSKFSHSRYSLSRITKKQTGNSLSGLDLEVFDSNYGGVRGIDTLSGGELFLASLSLAFGLSDVVQSYSGGIKLDSIFIDEGFGSLDDETLNVAINALNDIQNMGRMVGIISHVNELKSKIPMRIEVYKDKYGKNNVKIIGV